MECLEELDITPHILRRCHSYLECCEKNFRELIFSHTSLEAVCDRAPAASASRRRNAERNDTADRRRATEWHDTTGAAVHASKRCSYRFRYPLIQRRRFNATSEGSPKRTIFASRPIAPEYGT